MKWNKSKDDLEAMKIITRLANLLSHLRCVARTYGTENTQGSQYGYSVSLAEDPSRAVTLLANLAKGHALLEGRNYVTKKDIPIVIKTVLSTCPDRKDKHLQPTSCQSSKLDSIADNKISEHKRTNSLENHGRDQDSGSC